MEEQELYMTRKLLQLARMITHRRNAELSVLGLTASQADALNYFFDHPQKTVADLKQYLGVTHQTACGLVDRMADKELLTLAPSMEDGRCKLVSVTAKGQSLVAQMAKNRGATAQAMVQGMTEAECQAFYALLLKALDNMSDE
ncbi:MAG: MarR family transcriptional regulator [Peptococcaceae bacterium]|nr:MarR family transcriptional regulator [Peptococcaceae bacterium]